MLYRITADELFETAWALSPEHTEKAFDIILYWLAVHYRFPAKTVLYLHGKRDEYVQK